MDGDSITSRSSIFSDSASDDDWNAAIPAKIPTKEAANAACDTNATFKRNKTSEDSDELMAIKQVFERLSAKRAKQKGEQIMDCKRRLSEAFKTEINQVFKKAYCSREKVMDTSLRKLRALQSSLHSSTERTREKHAKYVEAYNAGVEKLTKQVTTLEALLPLLDTKYQECLEKVEMEYSKLQQRIESSLSHLELKLMTNNNDTSFFSKFQDQIQRINACQQMD